jgi:undecaprenyl pyrophosphate phosphatase UppP
LLDQLLTTIILGLIQGFAEWLPISSTAHLKITEHFLGFQATPLFNVFLHIGTLGVVIFYFRHDIKIVLTALVNRDFHSEYGRFIPLIIVATIPHRNNRVPVRRVLSRQLPNTPNHWYHLPNRRCLTVFLKVWQRKPNPNLLPQSPHHGSCTRSSQFSGAIPKWFNHIEWAVARREARDGFQVLLPALNPSDHR